MLTADTITDEEIRGLAADVTVTGEYRLIWVCEDALLDEAKSVHDHVRRQRARARCAEILNARTTKEP
jgi:hypothetical protein